MSPSAHLLILASAGTGKTWQLTNRFLQLLFDGVPPERILATTFTRKAAGEILDRVLERLVEACESPAACGELAQALGREGLTSEACLQLLADTTRHLNTFQVRTIDSFFVHLAKLFALDLKLPPGWSISDERMDNRVRSDTLLDLLGGLPLESTVELLRELKKGEAGRSVHTALLDSIRKLRDVELEAQEGAWDCLQLEAEVSAQQLATALLQFQKLDLPLTKKGTKVAKWVSTQASFCEDFEAQAWESIVSKGFGLKFLAGETAYSGKPFPEGMLEALTPLMAHACRKIVERLRARNLAAHDLLTAFEDAYQARKRSLGAFTFSDLPYALAPSGAQAAPLDERELDLWFRLDGRIDHLLLDEFQDTAPVQWRILAPIAEEITAEGDGQRSFFCVGDIKQSIYSFRQAEPRLLARLPSMLPALGKENKQQLHASYRSSSVVLDTVNRVFAGLEHNPIFDVDAHTPHIEACREFGESFLTHEAAKELTGAAYLIEAREPGNGDEKAALRERTVERVAAIHAQAPGASIGILTRTRKPIPSLIYALREKGIEASGEGGNVLTDSRAVLLFISLLHLADFPADSAAAFHVANSPFGKYVGLEPSSTPQECQEKSHELRVELGKLGLAGFITQFAKHLASDKVWSAWDRTRFGQLQDLAFIFVAGGEDRPSAFIDHVRKSAVEAPGGAAVRVMTIHASKGLEFDAVILPELNSQFAPRPADVLVDRPQPQDLIRGLSLPPGKPLLPVSAELVRMHHNQLARMVIDDLCVLYVAMTRAARRLELIVPWVDPEEQPSKTVKAPRIAGLLRNTLHPDGSEPDAKGVLWAHEENAQAGAWIEKGAIQAVPSAPPPAKFTLADFRSARNLPRRQPSSEEGGGKRSALDALRSSKGTNIGTLTHAIFESLEWAAGFQPEASLSQVKLRRASAADRQQALAIAKRALETTAIREALSEAGCGAPAGLELEVGAEVDFSLLDDGQLWNGSIDRLVLGRKAGRVIWAEIIDYKTDHIGAAGPAERVEHHRPQLERYARVVGELHGLAREAITCRLVFLSAGEVCTLG